MRHSRVLAVMASTVLLVLPAVTMAESVLPVGPFRSVTLRNGGHVVLRHGTEQRVTLLDGSEHCTNAATLDGDRLVIDRHQSGCPKGHKIQVEILSPDIEEIRVSDGGIIQIRGDFPRKAELQVAVEQGGTIDLRTMEVDRVTAAVKQGGRILTRPQETLVATVAHGGAITYWGNPRVTSSTMKGGVVSKGAADDADHPLIELDGGRPAVPAVPSRPRARVRARI